MFLYKFMPISDIEERISWIEKLIVNNEIYIPSAKKLNDPFELAVQWQSSEYATTKAASLYLLFEHENLIERTGVLSFSRRMDSVLMWSHYCASHSGVCFKFKVTNKNFYLNNFKKVEYSKIVPLKNKNDFLWTKSSEWKYEREVRYLSEENVNSYIKLPDIGLMLSNVILGPKAGIESTGKILKICNDSSKSLLQRARLHRNEYRVVTSIETHEMIHENYVSRVGIQSLLNKKRKEMSDI